MITKDSIALELFESQSEIIRIQSEVIEELFNLLSQHLTALELDKLTYKIAYAPRHPNEDNDFRFTEEEIEMLRKEYGKYLVKDNKAVIFNFDFFNAEIEELKELYERSWSS